MKKDRIFCLRKGKRPKKKEKKEKLKGKGFFKSGSVRT